MDKTLENIVCRNGAGEVECNLQYDEKLLMQDASNYLSHQFFEHRTAYEIFKKRLLVYRQKFKQELEIFNNDELTMESIPEQLRSFAKWLLRVCVLPCHLLRFTTPLTAYQRQMETHESAAAQYNVLKKCAEDGKTFFEECKKKYGPTLSRELSLRFDECIQEVDDVVQVLSDLSSAVVKFVDLEEKKHNLFYC
ncbi:MAG: hypothetical protein HY363_00645 [Candidatus Aenigmarchaeota archaeon]|nr:hypothetical protein [Candidatus Aenigmarchaeota archaeon]